MGARPEDHGAHTVARGERPGEGAPAGVPDANGHRPVHGGVQKLQDDPHWRDFVLFYEYFHGDNGAGIGASHQTGWTALVAGLIALFGTISPEKLKQEGAAAIGRQLATP